MKKKDKKKINNGIEFRFYSNVFRDDEREVNEMVYTPQPIKEYTYY